MIRYIEEDAAATHERGEELKVNLAHFLFLMSFNLVGNLVLSRDLLSSRSKEGKEFFDAMNEVMVWAGKPNLADFLPVLKWLDPQGIKRNMVRNLGRAMKIVSSFVEERIDELKLAKENTTKNLLDALLEHTGEGKEGSGTISNQNVIIIVLEMFFAGTIEWALAELLRNPKSLTKAKALDQVIGAGRRVEESDMWRRICVGISLAHKVVHFALASLLHSFDLELGNNICPEAIDMNERIGITVRKLIPLEAIPQKRVMHP
ncbi:hypothetical protein V6N12_003534 [Hibiscus sabdariffa]